METINSYSLSKLTDSDLSRLLIECGLEQARREERRIAERKKWVESCYYGFLSHPNASSIQMDDATVVAVYSRAKGVLMGTARPVHGDTFDRAVGIAVAYAKAIGTPVPDYI